MERLRTTFCVQNSKKFEPIRVFKARSKELAFQFAYDMSFGLHGEHRNHRSGGTHERKNGEIFSNTYQGKLAEFAIYNFFHNKYELPYPDLDTYELGKWDDCDLEINNKRISIKSTKSYGQLLLLETKDWNKNGEYIPNIDSKNASYDIFILARIKPGLEKIMRENRLFFVDECDRKQLEGIVLSNDWSYDIPGFITREDLIDIISNDFILPKGSYLNCFTVMDADNYYIQAGDLRNIKEVYYLLE